MHIKKRRKTLQKFTQHKMTKLSQKKVLNAMKDSYGVLTTIADRCDVTRVWMHKYVNKKGNEKIKELLQQERDCLIDLAEIKMVEIIKRGDSGMIRWFLSTMGKSRGYSTKEDFSNQQFEPIKITIMPPIESKSKNEGEDNNNTNEK